MLIKDFLSSEPNNSCETTDISLEDICAMKLQAIQNSGKKLKDFIDVYFLLEHFSLNQMLDFYQIKYKHSNKLIPLKAINYFDDIDPAIDSSISEEVISLHKVKERIQEATLYGNKNFKNYEIISH
ncbi:MAG: nucleotidyl transferase AbiEii/AbiGii toxin family protein [Flavobacterium sp.]